MSLLRYFKPFTGSGGTHSNLELLPDPNAESGESAIVSFPDPAFMKDKGLVHFAQNLGLPD